jgi:hypothetical protein
VLHRRLWPSTWDKKVSAFPLSSHSDSGEGAFSRLDYGSLLLRPVVLLALLSELTRLASSQRGRLHPGFRRFGRPRRRRISLQCQLGNLHWQDSHLLDHQLASLHYPGALRLADYSRRTRRLRDFHRPRIDPSISRIRLKIPGKVTIGASLVKTDAMWLHSRLNVCIGLVGR